MIILYTQQINQLSCPYIMLCQYKHNLVDAPPPYYDPQQPYPQQEVQQQTVSLITHVHVPITQMYMYQYTCTCMHNVSSQHIIKKHMF